MPSNSASVEGALSLWEAFHHQNEQDEYLLYHSHSAHNVTLRCIQNLNGFSIRIFLFTLRTQSDTPTYTSTTDQCGARPN